MDAREPMGPTGTIARVWVGHTRLEDRSAYERYLEETGMSGYRSAVGNRGAFLLVRDLDDHTEFVTLSFWDSWESIRAFAGSDPTRARYYEEDRRFLLSMPDTVDHYEIRSGIGGGVTRAPDRRRD